MEPSIWNDTVVTDLRALAELQFSAAKIAKQLAIKHGISVTRSAVIGKAHRVDIKLSGPPGQRQRRRLSPDEANARRQDHNLADRLRRQRKKAEREAGQALIASAPPIDEMEIAIGQRRTLLQLRDCDCRWPIGEPGTKGFFFCGGAKVGEAPYCAGHARIAYTKPAQPRHPYSRPVATYAWGRREP